MRFSVLPLLLTVSALVLGTGCSLKGVPDGKGLSVKLVPRQSELQSGTNDSLLNRDWMTLFGALPTQFSDLSCFGVNVRGGITPTAGTCLGKVDLGVTAGFQSGVTAPFTLSNVPLSEGLVFEAFGYSGTCADLTPAGMPANVSLYPLGSVTPAPAELAGTINVPVAFNSLKVFTCPAVGQKSILFNEDYSYGTGPTGLQTASGGIWQFATTDQTYGNPGQLNLLLGANQTDFVVAPVEDFTFTTYVISTKFKLTSSSGVVVHQVALGLADAATNGANSSGCFLEFSVSGTPTLNVAAGTGAGSLFTSSGPTGATPVLSTDTIAFTCEITKTGTGQHLITAVANDLTSSAQIGPTSTQTSDTCSGGCTHPYVSQKQVSGGGTLAGFMSGYLLLGTP